jgi:predicted O-methyltransferase YrrM
MNTYEFTNLWFQDVRPIWDELIPHANPTKILEIGSYEGASACYLIDKLASNHDIEIHCIDTWDGGVEHSKGGMAETDMNLVENRFHLNIKKSISLAKNKVDLIVHKQFSDMSLAYLMSTGKKNYFDFIYVDGSHQAPDVLCDAVLAFKLLKVGGYMVFDDYLWSESLPHGKDPIRCPKPAIDAFVNLNCRKLNLVSAQLNQLYINKISD